MIILDTDLVSIIQRQPSAIRELLLNRIDREMQFHPVVTSIITYEEQVRGWLLLLSQARTLQAQIDAYRHLNQHIEDYRKLQVVDFNESAAVAFQRLKSLKIRIGTMDLKIAGITLAHQASLWTRNLSDFRQVPGLSAIDPTV